MRGKPPPGPIWLWLLVTLWALCEAGKAAGLPSDEAVPSFPTPLTKYHDTEIPNVIDRLIHRVEVDPFNLVATIIFLCAITHTFLTSVFTKTARRYEREFAALETQELDAKVGKAVARTRDRLQFRAPVFGFLGEVEAVFGIWLVPLFLVIVMMKGWPALVDYSVKINAAEPIVVVAIMAIASSRPILRIAERGLASVAGFGGFGSAPGGVSIFSFRPLFWLFISGAGAVSIFSGVPPDRIFYLNTSPTPPLC